MRPPVYLIGGGKHAKIIIDILRIMDQTIAGIYDDNRNLTQVMGVARVGTIEELIAQLKSPTIAIGQSLICSIANNQIRAQMVDRINQASNHQPINWINAIHPAVYLSDSVKLGQGITICAGAILQPKVAIGDHTIINTKASIDHDCQIGNFVHVAPGATLCGTVAIGDQTMIGAGATVINNLSVGSQVMIGAGSNVVKSIPDHQVAYGNPCRLIRPYQLPADPPQPNPPQPKWPVFTESEINAAVQVLRSGQVNYWTGHQVKDFEREFAEYVGTKHAIALANGTLALELALKAINLQPEDQVIVTPRSFIASASSVVIAGNATPIFADVDPHSQNLTAENIRPHLTPQTKAVICVHLAGWPCPMKEILELCHARGIYVIEDCAQAHGARINGRSVGSFGDFGCWSFCQDKIITTGGEGGMVTLNDDTLYRKAWSYKDHGKDFDLIFHPDPNRPPGYLPLYTSLGTNWRMTEMQAAIGREMLKRLESMVDTRRLHANYFDRQLTQLQQELAHRPNLIQLNQPPFEVKHSYYRYYFKLTDPELRRQLLQLASQQKIACYAGSASQLYFEQGFTDYCPAEPLSNAQLLEQQSVCLLTDHTITQDYLSGVINLIKQVLSG